MSSIVPDVEVGNIGTTIKITLTKPDPSISYETYLANGATQRVPVDLDSATVVNIELEKPDGSRLALLVAAKTNPPGTDGKIDATDTTGLFTVVGKWKVRGIATFSNNYIFKGSWSPFSVSD